MLYVHGGAYFFGSLETHRYQMQRHARKLKARVFARYVILFLTRYDCLLTSVYSKCALLKMGLNPTDGVSCLSSIAAISISLWFA